MDTCTELSSLLWSDLDIAEKQPDVEEPDFAPTGKEEEERQEEPELAAPPTEQEEEEPTHGGPEDEPDDKQDEPEDMPEDTPVEPESHMDEPVEIEEEELAEEPSALQEHEPDQLEMQEECPPAIVDDKAETQREVGRTEATESKPEKRDHEKRELTSRKHVKTQGELRKDKKGPEQIDFRNVLRKTESPASAIASSKFYQSSASKAAGSEAKQVGENMLYQRC